MKLDNKLSQYMYRVKLTSVVLRAIAFLIVSTTLILSGIKLAESKGKGIPYFFDQLSPISSKFVWVVTIIAMIELTIYLLNLNLNKKLAEASEG